MTNKLDYYKYLRTRSKIGGLYRKYYLYPRLQKYMHKKVLDVGCGVGDYLRFNKNADGVDINIHNINYLRSINLNAILMEENVLPFKSESYPSILMDNVLEHINEPNKILEEIYRILSPNGTLIIGVPGEKGYSLDDDHKVFYDEKKLINLLTKYKFHFKKTIITPIRLKLLSRYLRQYCIYVIVNK